MRIGAVILIVFVMVLVAIVAFRSRQGHHRAHPPDPDVMKNLRLRVLQENAPSGALPASRQAPFAIIMDLGMENGTASVFSALTGDASIYLSSGGGIIGGIGHENVSRVAIAFTQESGKHLSDDAATAAEIDTRIAG